MRIICPGCANHYELDADKIGAAGQLVRCAKCNEVWRATRETPSGAAPPVQVPERDRGGPPPRGPDRTSSLAWPPPVVDMEAARQRLRPHRPAAAGRFRGTLAVLALGTLVLTAGVTTVSRRDAIARELPSATSVFNALGLRPETHGLALRDVSSRLVEESGKTVLILQGEIANLGTEPAAVPALTAAVRDGGQVPLYTWTAAASKTLLAGGETATFQTRLAAPPATGKDVRVSLVNETAR